MTNLAQAIRNEKNYTLTENAAVALKSTGNALLDLFSMAGAIRQKDYEEVSRMFQAAFGEDKLLATKLMFYARNVRGGLGERDTFRKMLRSLAETNAEIVIKNMELIPFFGRYDDLYTLVGTRAENEMWMFLAKTIAIDYEKMKAGKPISLCAKWLKSINTSSKESVALGRMTAKQFNMTEKEYRKALSTLREYIKVIERTMSAKDWEEIAYSQVPSRAMKNYRKAFSKHDGERFGEYINKVSKGEAKINSGTLYPYDILEAAHMRYWSNFEIDEDPVLEEQWKALPNYIKEAVNALVMADTSGSMEGRPMAIALGLALYFAERNTGAYKDLFMTFSESPEFVELSGKTLAERVSHVRSIVANTDLEKGMDLILQTAIQNNVSQEEMPKYLIVISDMHFDAARDSYQSRGWGEGVYVKKTFHQSMKAKFASAGYEMPLVVYWNVDERSPAIAAKMDDSGVLLASGASTSTFKSIINSLSKTPMEFMYEVLNDPQYDVVTI